MSETDTSSKCSCDCQQQQPTWNCDYYRQHGCMPPPHFCPFFPPCPPPPWPPFPPPPPPPVPPSPTSDCDHCPGGCVKDLPAISSVTCFALDLNTYEVSSVENAKPNAYRLDKILFRPITGGEFVMGSLSSELGRYSQIHSFLNFEPLRNKEVSDFSIGVFPVTQRQFEKVTGKKHGNRGCGCEKDYGDVRFALPCRAKDFVSWNDVSSFVKTVNEKLAANNQQYEVAMPTDEQWEYAARAGQGQEHPWSASDVSAIVKNEEDSKLPPEQQKEETLREFTRQATNLSCYASYLNGDVAEKVKFEPARFPPVGCFKPNAWDLYDTLGCVWEWINQDWRIEKIDPKTHDVDREYLDDEGKAAKLKTVRGGGYWFNADDCRCANRHGYPPDFRNYGFGFRLVLKRK